MKAPSPDFLELLKTMFEHKVDFIIVGGVSAVLHGAPVTTFDLDLLHSREPDNIEKLLVAIKDLDAYYRGVGERRIEPGKTQLSSTGHQLLMTRLGPLDLLGTIGKERYDYTDLLEHTKKMQISGMTFLVLDLETHIQIKEGLGHDKDKAIVPILRRTLEEKAK
jgi:predicted nucleotidyltransferase